MSYVKNSNIAPVCPRFTFASLDGSFVVRSVDFATVYTVAEWNEICGTPSQALSVTAICPLCDGEYDTVETARGHLLSVCLPAVARAIEPPIHM